MKKHPEGTARRDGRRPPVRGESCPIRPSPSALRTGRPGDAPRPGSARLRGRQRQSAGSEGCGARRQASADWEFAPQTGSDSLEDPVRSVEIPQAMLSQIPQGDAGAKYVCGERCRARREQHLTSMRGVHETGAQRLRATPSKSPSRSWASPAWTAMRTGSSSRSCASMAARTGLGGRREHCANSVTRLLEHPAPMGRYRARQIAIVARQHDGHGVRVRLPAARAALDVSEEKDIRIPRPGPTRAEPLRRALTHQIPIRFVPPLHTAD